MLQNSVAKKYTYATKQDADFRVKTLECEFTGMLLKIQSFDVWTTLVGNFNAQNLLSVYATADLLGLSSLSILRGISELKSVEGRFHVFQSMDKITVVIDYAHTPDALFNVLSTINMIRTRNENLVFKFREKQNQCSIDPKRKKINLILLVILLLIFGVVFFLAMDSWSAWYFDEYIVPQQQIELNT
jgi:UDP-N-acetylmuramate-alanine ligase